MFSTFKSISLSPTIGCLPIGKQASLVQTASAKLLRELVRQGVLPTSGKWLLFLFLTFSTTSLWAEASKKAEKLPIRFSTLTVSKSSFLFNTKVGVPSDAQQLTVSISGVSSTAQTFITVPDPYTMFVPLTNSEGETIIITGNSTLTFLVQFKGSAFAGTFPAKLTISGNAIISQSLSLTTTVLAEPIFPVSSMFFSTVLGVSPALQELDITLEGVSATSQTTIQVPAPFSIFTSPTGPASKTLTAIGSGRLIVFVGVDKTATTGTFSGKMTVTNPQAITKTLPLAANILPVPTPITSVSSLTGFSAVQGGTLSGVQSFDLSITGLPTQGTPTVFVSAPTGYLVSLSGIAGSFLNTFILSTNNGSIKSKLFVALSGNNPVGPITGNISITGSQIKSKTMALSGSVTAKPQPTLSLDKTSLSGFITLANKASAIQSYNLKATNLATGVTATVIAPTGFEISLSNTSGSTFFSQLTLLQSSGSINANVFVRLKSQSTTGTKTGNIQHSVAGLSKTLAVSGTVNAPPSLTISTLSLTGFSTVKNQASASKTYTVVASNLSTGVVATVTAPTNYEVRLQNTGSFTSTLTLTQTSSGSINRIVEVRLKATTLTGTITGVIQHGVAGISKTLNVGGTVATPVLSLSTSGLTGFSSIQNQPSAPKSYTLSASNLATGINAVVTAPAGFEVSLQGSTIFAASLTLTQTSNGAINKTILVRLKAQTITGSKSGNITHTVAGISKTVALSGTVQTASVTTSALADGGDNEADGSIKAFPNPFQDQLTVEFEEPLNQIIFLRLLDFQGNLLFKQELLSTGGVQQVNLPVGELRKGIYLLEMVRGTKRKTRQVIKD